MLLNKPFVWWYKVLGVSRLWYSNPNLTSTMLLRLRLIEKSVVTCLLFVCYWVVQGTFTVNKFGKNPFIPDVCGKTVIFCFSYEYRSTSSTFFPVLVTLIQHWDTTLRLTNYKLKLVAHLKTAVSHEYISRLKEGTWWFVWQINFSIELITFLLMMNKFRNWVGFK